MNFLKMCRQLFAIALAVMLLAGLLPVKVAAEEAEAFASVAKEKITAFGELSEDIRFQRGFTPNLPEKVAATAARAERQKQPPKSPRTVHFPVCL